jgi:toxin ParE1/3/4
MSDLGAMAVRFDDEADAELLDAGQYYAERSPKAAAGFASEVEAALEQIQQMPWSAPAWPGRPDLRRRVLARYPYAIVYMVVEPAEILVVAVEHVKRRPGYWLGRVR